MVRWVLLPIVAAFISACASTDSSLLDRKTPPPPTSWAASGAVASTLPIGDWVGGFGDDTLNALVAEAMQHNNNLLATLANVEAVKGSARIARANLLPTVNASASAARSAVVATTTNPQLIGLDKDEAEARFGVDANADGALDGLDLDGDGIAETPLQNRRNYGNSYGLTGALSWEIDLWGRLTDETRAAYKDLRASYADLLGTELSIAGATARAWFSLIEARQQRELSERDVEARERNLRITERRYERGVASSLDVRLSRSALGSSAATLAQRQQLELEASRNLEVLLGRYPAAEIEAAPALPALPALDGAGAPIEILTRRPDLIAAAERMDAAGLRARAAQKQLLPSLTLTSSINTAGPVLGDLIDPEQLAGNIAAGLFQPLFQGGRLTANAKRARATATASLLSYAQTVLEAYKEAENALSAEAFLLEREAALKIAFEEAEASERLTERRYTNGTASIFNLLDAQTRRISAESTYISAQQNRLANRVQLYLAIGGEFLTAQDIRMLEIKDRLETVSADISPDNMGN